MTATITVTDPTMSMICWFDVLWPIISISVTLNDPSELTLIDAFGSNVPKKVMTDSVPFVKLKVNGESIFNTGGSGLVTTISSLLRAAIFH